MLNKRVAQTLGVLLLATAGTAAISGPVQAAPFPTTPYLAGAADPAVTTLAAETGISVAEARQRIGWQVPAAELDEQLRSTMDEGFGGLWIDQSDRGRIKIGITRVTAAAAFTSAISARRLGGVTDLVPVQHSYASLERANEWLGRAMAQVNDGKGADLTSIMLVNKNVVELRLPDGEALTAGQREVVRHAQAMFGSMITLGTWSGRVYDDACGLHLGSYVCDAPLRAGVRTYNSSLTAWCSTAFTARSLSDNKWYIMTAGHCGDAGEEFWTYQHVTDDFHKIGAVHNAIDPGTSDDDMAIITINNVAGWDPRPWVYVKDGVGQGVPGSSEDQDYVIEGVSTSPVGTRVCMSSGNTGTSCGEVTGINHNGITGGKAEANYCRQGGDSGAAVFSGGRARGIHSGSFAPGNFCGNALFQGAVEAANKLNVYIVTG